MMGTRGSFFMQVYLRNAATQRRKQERGDEQGRFQNLPLQSPEPSRDLNHTNFESESIEEGASPVPGQGGRKPED
jgi:hypothetical protein